MTIDVELHEMSQCLVTGSFVTYLYDYRPRASTDCVKDDVCDWSHRMIIRQMKCVIVHDYQTYDVCD